MISTLETIYKDVDDDELGLKADDGFVFIRAGTGWYARFLQYPPEKAREIGQALIALADALKTDGEGGA